MERLSTPTQVYERNENIIVRTAEVTDAAMIVDYFNTNRDYLKPFEPKREHAFFRVDGWTQRLIKLNELHKMGLGYYLVIQDRASLAMLGTISFSNMSRFPFYACNVGYSLAEKAQGNGIMTQALSLAVNYMFKVQNMHRLMAAYMPKNVKSGAVLERVGFKKEGEAQDYLLIDDRWEDHILTSLTNPDWIKE
ncbi:[SSU ribosomal protein S5P]-alanine acetyltransferase [Vibrio xiamenensis]|uniref:[SSU ribosomal protein S5P]-alanine acetyltransferase n=1 Tax=Vibrio xiamenensis TaxID=861298 RepID=A0A1G7ZQB0_9VIBR|nr:ribosomal protein S5-alanine N-acetyltransferase [Vibrio xiamenensis]SDH10736.1 [SSU ribosomal protein S5P]-alanine acetyltransferase [Vibrio xiamenensis]